MKCVRIEDGDWYNLKKRRSPFDMASPQQYALANARFNTMEKSLKLQLGE